MRFRWAVMFFTLACCSPPEPESTSTSTPPPASKPSSSPATQPGSHSVVSALASNVLLITLDTTRADRLGCYGGDDNVSPVIDALAQSGVVFETAYAVTPITLPSHTSLMTGLTPIEHGVRNNGQFRLSPQAMTLAESLQAAGMQTAAFVSAQVLAGEFGLDQGFEVYDDDFADDATTRNAAETTAAFTRWLQERSAADRFFVWLHYYDPHTPYDPPFAWRGKFASAYEAEIRAVDDQIQTVLEHLDRRQIRDDTLICITADHGESLGEHGESSHGTFLYDASMRIPMIIAHPGLSPRRIASPVRLEDMAPAIQFWALGGPPHAKPILTSLAAADVGVAPARPLYLESYLPYLSFSWSPLQALVWEQWKYIDAPTPELYDLVADPGETDNCLAAHSDAAAKLRSELIRQRQLPVAWESGATVDSSLESRLAELGYVVAGEAAAELPEPGRAAGPDPKQRVDALPWLYSLLNAQVASRPREIDRCAREVLRRDPGNPLAARCLGVEMVRQGKYAEARQWLEPLAARDRMTGESDLALGIALLHTNEVPACIPLLERSRREPRTRERALRWLADAAERQQRNEDARAYYQELLEIWSGPAEARVFIENKLRGLE